MVQLTRKMHHVGTRWNVPSSARGRRRAYAIIAKKTVLLGGAILLLEDDMRDFVRSLRPVLLAAVFLAAPAYAADQFINVLTGGTSGVYYPLGVALSNSIGKAIPGAKTAVQ